VAPGLTRPAVLARAAGLLVLGALTLAILRRGLAPSIDGHGLGPAGGVLAFIHMIDLVFHEAGHPIFGLFGRFLGALGGSLNQVLIPALCTGYFLWHGQRAAAAVTLFWTGENVVDVAIYAADGRDMRLPLLAEGLTHDWNWILSELSLRNQAEPIGRAIFVLGALTLLAALALLALDLLRQASGPASTGVLPSPSTPNRKPT
jgi:hypothetical protein